MTNKEVRTEAVMAHRETGREFFADYEELRKLAQRVLDARASDNASRADYIDAAEERFIDAVDADDILDLLSELARVRGLLQRAILAANGRWEEWGDRALAVKELLDEAGAESADIGKLDRADEK